MSPHIGPDLGLNVNVCFVARGITADNTIGCKTMECSIAFRQHDQECCGFANWLRYHGMYLTARGLSRVACDTTYSDFYPEGNCASKPAYKIHCFNSHWNANRAMKIGFCIYAEAALLNTTYLRTLNGLVH